MSSILGKRRNVHPVVLLDEHGTCFSVNDPSPDTRKDRNIQETPQCETPQTQAQSSKLSLVIDEGAEIDDEAIQDSPVASGYRRRPKKTCIDILQNILDDNREYRELKLNIWKQKLAIHERLAAAAEKRNQLLEKKIQLLEKLFKLTQ